MSRSQYHDRCACGASKVTASERCNKCAQAARLDSTSSRVPTDAGNERIPELEPSRSWECPDCTYRITDERSVVNDAVLEHQRAHKRVAA